MGTMRILDHTGTPRSPGISMTRRRSAPPKRSSNAKPHSRRWPSPAPSARPLSRRNGSGASTRPPKRSSGCDQYKGDDPVVPARRGHPRLGTPREAGRWRAPRRHRPSRPHSPDPARSHLPARRRPPGRRFVRLANGHVLTAEEVQRTDAKGRPRRSSSRCSTSDSGQTGEPTGILGRDPVRRRRSRSDEQPLASPAATGAVSCCAWYRRAPTSCPRRTSTSGHNCAQAVKNGLNAGFGGNQANSLHNGPQNYGPGLQQLGFTQLTARPINLGTL